MRIHFFPARHIAPFGSYIGLGCSAIAALALATSLSSFSLNGASFVHESPAELLLTADLDGDGREDMVIVDRESGGFRVGYQLVADTFTYTSARSSGLRDVTSVTAGKFGSLTRDSLIFASKAANRLQLVSASDPNVHTSPIPIHLSGIGPDLIIGIDIGGGGNTDHTDLFATTTENNPPNGLLRHLIRHNGATFTQIVQTALTSQLGSGNPVVVKDGVSPMAGVIEETGGNVFWRAYSLTAGTAQLAVSSGAEAGQAWRHGNFDETALHHTLSYTPGTTQLIARKIQEPAPNSFFPSSPLTYDLGDIIDQVFVLNTTPANRILVVMNNAESAIIYEYDGSQPPSPLQTLQLPPGEKLTGAIPLANGNVHLLTGHEGRTHRFHSFRLQGGMHQLHSSGDMPPPNPLGTLGNVFLFQSEPFVSPLPGLVRILNAADWSSQLNLNGGTVQVQAEALLSSHQGLANPSPRNLGAKPAVAAFGLVNQYQEQISVMSFQAAIGDPGSEPKIQPPPGAQPGAVVVEIRTVTPTHEIHYRRGRNASWQMAIGVASFQLFQDTTVQYYANAPASSTRSMLHEATYTFPSPPAEQDSDGDGVPDFVEIEKGLDPNGGADSDGDGYTDKEELFAGTNPLNVNDPPAAVPIPRIGEGTAFDLLASPRGFDGATATEVSPVADHDVFLYDLEGSLRDRRRTTNNAGALFQPSAGFINAPADTTLGLLSISTEPHFPLPGDLPDRDTGRELLSVFPVPQVVPTPFEFVPSDSELLAQADAWIAAAKAAQAAQTNPRYATRFGVLETLSALLLERKLHIELLVRGTSSITEEAPLTLFPNRANDVTRTPLTSDDIEALANLGPAQEPAWNLAAMHSALSNAIPAGAHEALRKLANDIYRSSALSNHLAPGALPLPVDALRQVIETGVLHPNYLAQTATTPAERTSAVASIATLLDVMQPRPVETFDLEVLSDSFQFGCTTLQTVGTLEPKNLFVAYNTPYTFPESFRLIPGSRVRVTAFTDFEGTCPGEALQVITAQLLFVPAPTLADVNGNLLPDDWECLFLAGAGDPFGDQDEDGISNLQELIDETDPNDPLSKADEAEDLSPPAIVIEVVDGDSIIEWEFPPGYADFFEFTLWQTPGLGEDFVSLPIVPIQLPNGKFQILLPAVQADAEFFLLTIQIKELP